MKIAVIGGSGLIGSRLVAKLREHGHEAVSAALDTGVNTLTGEGLTAALQGASVVVDVSNAPTFEDAAVLEFFEASTRNLLDAEAAAGVAHHVALSIVGTDRLPDSGYNRAKLAQEKLIAGSSIPYSIVHATQFFEFIEGIAQAATDGDTVRVAPALIQPIAADDVATALAGIAVDTPVNGIVEVAGPEQFRLDELIRRVLNAHDDPRQIIVEPHTRTSAANSASAPSSPATTLSSAPPASTTGSISLPTSSRDDDRDHPEPTELTVTNDERDEQPDHQLLFLQEQVEEHATIAGDIVKVGTHTWAIHGSIAVDGEVIMAEYDTRDQARLVLDKLSSEGYGTAAP